MMPTYASKADGTFHLPEPALPQLGARVFSGAMSVSCVSYSQPAFFVGHASLFAYLKSLLGQ